MKHLEAMCPTPAARKAVAEFARGILRFVEDGNVVELREVGFVTELTAASRLDAGPEDEKASDDYSDGDEGEDEFEDMTEAEVIDRMGWDEDSVLLLQRRFIAEGRPGDYVDWLKRQAREEERECSG